MLLLTVLEKGFVIISSAASHHQHNLHDPRGRGPLHDHAAQRLDPGPEPELGHPARDHLDPGTGAVLLGGPDRAGPLRALGHPDAYFDETLKGVVVVVSFLPGLLLVSVEAMR